MAGHIGAGSVRLTGIQEDILVLDWLDTPGQTDWDSEGHTVLVQDWLDTPGQTDWDSEGHTCARLVRHTRPD